MNNLRAMLRPSILAALAIFTSFALVNPVLAATITTTVTVNGDEMPWNWVNGGLNTSDQFGVNDGRAGPGFSDERL